jgi:hypothetical protein
LAIPHSLAHQERRAIAFMAGPSGLSYFFPHLRMDTPVKSVRGLFAAAYSPDQKPRFRHNDHFHLGWMFDATVIIALLIAAVGLFTA